MPQDVEIVLLGHHAAIVASGHEAMSEGPRKVPDVDRLIRFADIVAGVAALAGVLGWIAAGVVRLAFRQAVSFPDWVLQAAGWGGAVGVLVAVVDALT
jgi:hypothetical protein